MKLFNSGMQKSRLLLLFSASTILASVFSFNALAKNGDRRDIRFYKANKILQTERIRFTRKKAAQSGCHNFIKKARVFKIVQFGYAACYVYSKKDCMPDSIVGIAREKDEITSAVVLEGYGWYPYSDIERGVKLKSWSCGNEQSSTIAYEGFEIESRAQAEARIKEMEREQERQRIEAEQKAREETYDALDETNQGLNYSYEDESEDAEPDDSELPDQQ